MGTCHLASHACLDYPTCCGQQRIESNLLTVLQVRQKIEFSAPPLSENPTARDIMQHVAHLDVKLSIYRPSSLGGIGYGICDAVFEDLPSIKALDAWLAERPKLQKMSLIIDSNLKFVNGSRLGINWNWLLQLLAPLKVKYSALKIIGFDDRQNFSDGKGFCWTFKDPRTGEWSKLREMGAHELTPADFYADMAMAKMDIK